MKARPRKPHGSALLTAVVLVAVLLVIVAGIIYYTNQRRLRTISTAQSVARLSCAEAGLELAKNYFGRTFPSWNSYLANPATYNPYNYTTWPAYSGPAAFNGVHPPNVAPYFDLDGDGLNDVFIYIRDNADELPPASNNWAQDNDQNVFVGAICISSTMTPKLVNGSVDQNQLVAESLLSYNMQSTYTGQAGGGSSGTGNLNN